MSNEYPVRFTLSASTSSKGPKDAAVSNQATSEVNPKFKITPLTKSGQECSEFRLAEIEGWPETKAEMEQACVDLPFGLGRACTDLPRIYTRKCTKYVYLKVCHPSGMLSDVEECVKGAALAGAMAAIISSPASAVPAFEVALKGCLAAKGAGWSDQISASAGWDSSCGDWSPV